MKLLAEAMEADLPYEIDCPASENGYETDTKVRIAVDMEGCCRIKEYNSSYNYVI